MSEGILSSLRRRARRSEVQRSGPIVGGPVYPVRRADQERRQDVQKVRKFHRLSFLPSDGSSYYRKLKKIQEKMRPDSGNQKRTRMLPCRFCRQTAHPHIDWTATADQPCNPGAAQRDLRIGRKPGQLHVPGIGVQSYHERRQHDPSPPGARFRPVQ